MAEGRVGDRPTSWALATSSANTDDESLRGALTFFLSKDGAFIREFLLEETVRGIDCLGRGGLQSLAKQLAAVSPLRFVPGVGQALLKSPLGPLGDLFAPPLTSEEELVVANVQKLLAFLVGDSNVSGEGNTDGGLFSGNNSQKVVSAVQLISSDPELVAGARQFAIQLGMKLFNALNARVLRRLARRIDEPVGQQIRAQPQPA